MARRNRRPEKGIVRASATRQHRKIAQHIDVTKSVSLELRRIINQQLHHARVCLERVRDGSAEEPIHEFRKATKRLRATLRALKKAFAKPARRIQVASLRKAAAQFARYRDAVIVEHTLREAYADLMPGADLEGAPWREISLGQWAIQHLAQAPSDELIDSAGRLLDTCAEALSSEGLSQSDFDVFLLGTVRTYRSARRQMRAFGEHPSCESLHWFRRRVKDQFYQMRLLVELERKSIRTELKDLDRLAEILGHHHDLGNLLNAAVAANSSFRQEELPGLVEWIELRLSQLRREAVKLGRSVFREPPGKRRRRLRRLYRDRLGTNPTNRR